MPVQFSYMVQNADGSTQTLTSEATRPPTWGELDDHVTSTGAQLLPATPAEQPAPPPASSVPPPAADRETYLSAAPPAAPPPPPSFGQRARAALVPERSFWSQLPSVGGAIAGAEVGGELGALGGPFAPVTIPVGAVAGAALGSGGMEAARVGAERYFGWQPAEQAPASERIANAALRGGVFEAVPLGAKYVVGAPILRSAIPAAQGAKQLAPVLAQVPEAAPATMQPLAQWWAHEAPAGAENVVKAWSEMGGPARAALAGEHLPAMQQIVDAVAAGKPMDWASAATQGLITGYATLQRGYPAVSSAVAGAVPAIAQGATRAVPALVRRAVLSPTGSQWLAAMPAIGNVVGPLMNTALRTGAQLGGAYAWPRTSEIFEGPPPPPG